ncbi:MAG: hypothetical protein U1D30_01410 [Planctomycetota bacterium]
MKQRWLLFSGWALLALAGCAELQEDKIDGRNRYLARRAWEQLQVVYKDFDYTDDFGRGFKQGYFNVASGGNGCPPMLPPKHYWSVKYASPKGHQRTHAYFEGYRYGAIVAEQDGVGIWISLPTSRPGLPQEAPFRPDEGPTPLVAEEGSGNELQEIPATPPAVPEEPAPTPEPSAPEESMPEEAKPGEPAAPQNPFKLEPRRPDDQARVNSFE